MLNRWPTGTDLAIGLAAFLLIWFVVGLQVNRRRAGTLVRQVRDSLQAFGGTATIRWIGRSAFRIEAEQLVSPFVRLGLSVLLEPRETFLLWVVGRLTGRRDWLMMSVTLNGSVGTGFEVYHPRRRGASDSAHEIRSRGWRAESMPGRPALLWAAPHADGRALAQEIMSALGRIEVWRVRVRREEPQLSISLPIPVSETKTPLPIFAVLPRLAQTVLARGSRR